MKTLSVRIPGSTSNLGAGFDTLGFALQLYLRLQVRVLPAPGVRIELAGEGAQTLPRDETNLVCAAYRAACSRFGIAPLGLHLQMTNEIPLNRGLGSSGAATAAGLVMARALAGMAIPDEQMVQLGAELEGHPENVSASLLGGVTVSCLAENRCATCRILPPKPLVAVALIPDFWVSTKEARAILPGQVPLADAVFNVQRAALLVASLTSGNYSLMEFASDDRLHQPYRATLVPGLAEVLEAARRAGAYAAFLSGSGSTMLAFAGAAAPGVALAMQQAAAGRGYSYQCKILSPDTTGACMATAENSR